MKILKICVKVKLRDGTSKTLKRLQRNKAYDLIVSILEDNPELAKKY